MILEKEISIFNVKEYLSEFRNRMIEYLDTINIIQKGKSCLRNEINNYDIALKLKQNIDYAKKLKIYLKANVKKVIDLIGLLNRTDYRTVIKYRYISGWKWQDIQKFLYGNESDYEYEPEKYKDRIMCKHRQALETLQKLIFKTDDAAAYKFIANIIFNNKNACKEFNEKYQNTHIHKYLSQKYNKGIGRNDK